MVQYIIKENGRLRELNTPVPRSWINITAPFNQEELEELAFRFDVPIEFFTDSLDTEERSRYEQEDDVRLIVINTPILNDTEKDNDAIYITVPIGIILTKENIITITSFENTVLELFLDDKIKNFDPARYKTFVLQIFEQTVYRYLQCLKKLNLKRNLIEEELYTSSRNSELIQLLRIEKSLVYFVSSLSSNELMKIKLKRIDFLHIKDNEDLMDMFESIIIDNSQALEMSNIYTNILNGTMEAYSTIISNNLNLFINRLTLVTIVISVPTLISSLWGMNVKVPFQENSYAFIFIFTFSVALAIFFVWFLRRRKLF